MLVLWNIVEVLLQNIEFTFWLSNLREKAPARDVFFVSEPPKYFKLFITLILSYGSFASCKSIN
jgi:hypothetical protein